MSEQPPLIPLCSFGLVLANTKTLCDVGWVLANVGENKFFERKRLNQWNAIKTHRIYRIRQGNCRSQVVETQIMRYCHLHAQTTIIYWKQTKSRTTNQDDQ